MNPSTSRLPTPNADSCNHLLSLLGLTPSLVTAIHKTLRHYRNMRTSTRPRSWRHPKLYQSSQEKNETPTIPHHKNSITSITEPTPPPFTKLAKHYRIITHQERQKRISSARRRGTIREKLHHGTNQHPLSDYWPDIAPQSLPITLHPPYARTYAHFTQYPHHRIKNHAPLLTRHPPATPRPPDSTVKPTKGKIHIGLPTPHPSRSSATPPAKPKTTDPDTHLQTINRNTHSSITKDITLITQNTNKRAATAHPTPT